MPRAESPVALTDSNNTGINSLGDPFRPRCYASEFCRALLIEQEKPCNALLAGHKNAHRHRAHRSILERKWTFVGFVRMEKSNVRD